MSDSSVAGHGIDPEFAGIAAHFISFLFIQKKMHYPDALLFGGTFPLSLAIEARQRHGIGDPTFTPATCVSDHMLGSPRLREMTDTPFAPGDFVFSLRWRQRQEEGNFDLSDGKMQGYVDVVVLYVAATMWFMMGRPQMAFSDVIRDWPAFNALDGSVKEQAARFTAAHEAWAKRVVERKDVIEGRSFMDRLLALSEEARTSAPRLKGIRTARDTLLVHVVLLTIILAGKLEIVEADDSEDELDLTDKAMELAPDGDPRLKGPSLMFLGDSAMKVGKQDLALDAYSEALPLCDATGESEDATECCLALGHVFLEKADYASAEQWILEAERRMREEDRLSNLPACQATLAQVHMQQRRTDDALALLRSAQEGFRKSGKAADAVRCVALEVELLAVLGLDNEAEKLLLSLTAQDRADIDSLHGASLGLLRLRQGRLDEAASLLSNALRAAVASGELYRVPKLNCNLAYIRYLQGRLAESVALFDEAEELHRRAGMVEEIWDCHISRALVWVAQHKFTVAIADLNSLLELGTDINAGTRAEVHFMLGQLLLQQPKGDLDAAEAAVRQAEEIFERQGRHYAIAHCHRVLGEIRRKQGALDEAEALFMTAAAGHDANGDLDNANDCRYELALVFRDRANALYWSDHERAISFAAQAEQALWAIRSANGSGPEARDPQLAWRVAYLLAVFLQAQEPASPNAMELLIEVVNTFDRHWSAQSIADDRLATGDIRYSALLDAALLAAKSGDYAVAYELMLDAKGREGREVLGAKALSSAVESLPDPDRAALRDLLLAEEEQQRMLEEASAAKSVRSNQSGAFATANSGPEKSAVIARLADLRREIRQAMTSISMRHPWFSALANAQKVLLKDVQAALHENEVLLDYFVHRGSAFVFVVTRSSDLKVFELDSEYIVNTTVALDDLVKKTEHQPQPHLESDPLARIGGAFLPDELVLLRPAVERADVVLISPPSSHYGRVPWTLMASSGYFRMGSGFSGGEKLVGVMPAASWLPLTRGRYLLDVSRPHRAWIVAADADPDRPLPQATVEAKRIAGVYGVMNEGHLEALAPGSYEALRDMPSAAALHITAHGRIDAESGVSGILLLNRAGERRAVGPEVFWTSKAEAPLVAVLSLCWSGAAAGSSSGEWLGLATALLNKGTQAVVVCCWPVDDFAARLLFHEMHRQWWSVGVPIGADLERARDRLAGATLSDLFSAGLLNEPFGQDDELQIAVSTEGAQGEFGDLFHRAVYVLLGDPSVRRP